MHATFRVIAVLLLLVQNVVWANFHFNEAVPNHHETSFEKEHLALRETREPVKRIYYGAESRVVLSKSEPMERQVTSLDVFPSAFGLIKGSISPESPEDQHHAFLTEDFSGTTIPAQDSPKVVQLHPAVSDGKFDGNFVFKIPEELPWDRVTHISASVNILSPGKPNRRVSFWLRNFSGLNRKWLQTGWLTQHDTEGEWSDVKFCRHALGCRQQVSGLLSLANDNNEWLLDENREMQVKILSLDGNTPGTHLGPVLVDFLRLTVTYANTVKK